MTKNIRQPRVLSGTTQENIEELSKQAREILDSTDLSDYDKKLIANTVVELSTIAQTLQSTRHIPKISIFGSARTAPNHPDYLLCKQFSQNMAKQGYSIITGGGPGIMAAGHDGIPHEQAVGLGIQIPFEDKLNPFTTEATYQHIFKYFYCRKLAFVREAEAIVLFPGGTGTMDEVFEVVTLMGKGRSMPVPVVLINHPNSDYWKKWLEYMNYLKDYGTLDKGDIDLCVHTHDIEEAASYINGFYQRYHSLCYQGDTVIIRLSEPLPENVKTWLLEKYADFLGDYGIQEHNGPLDGENEPELTHLPRITIQADNTRPRRLFSFVRSLNKDGPGHEFHISSDTPPEEPRPTQSKT